ncbi:unnamed protein product, partial [Strongylus vulgaris]
CDVVVQPPHNEPRITTLTISPKIWDFLDRHAELINDALRTVEIPEINKKSGFIKYRLWNGKIENFSIPKDGISFKDMKGGVHLSVKNVSFNGITAAQVKIGTLPISGHIRISYTGFHPWVRVWK